MSSNLRLLELEIVKKMFPFHRSTGNMTPSALSGSKRSKNASITTVPLLENLENRIYLKRSLHLPILKINAMFKAFGRFYM